MAKLIKHRGISNSYIKENSYEGLKEALESDLYLGVEFDIRCTKDNYFILYHDPIYNNKLISNMMYAELPKYVPKLEDILKIKSNKIFLIEIKNINNNYDKLEKILNKHLDKKIYVMSFSNRVINKMMDSKRNYKLGILNYVLNTSDFINDLDFVGILNILLNKSIIDVLKGKEIFSYGLGNDRKYKNVYYIVDK